MLKNVELGLNLPSLQTMSHNLAIVHFATDHSQLLDSFLNLNVVKQYLENSSLQKQTHLIINLHVANSFDSCLKAKHSEALETLSHSKLV